MSIGGRDETAPWLAPDGREWFPPYRPVTCPWLGRSYARRRRTFLAAGQYCETLRTASFVKPTLWRPGLAPWEF